MLKLFAALSSMFKRFKFPRYHYICFAAQNVNKYDTKKLLGRTIQEKTKWLDWSFAKT